jgi:hypothetical protein
MPQCEPHHPQALHKVQLENGTPVVVSAVGDMRPALATSHIVDQDVDAAERCDGRLDQEAEPAGETAVICATLRGLLREQFHGRLCTRPADRGSRRPPRLFGAGVLDLSLQDPGAGDVGAMMRALELFGKKVLPRIREI